MIHEVLVIEDSKLVGQMLSASLEKKGFATTTITTSQELDLLNPDRIPNIVILDLQIPDTTPEEVAERLIQLNNDIKIIIYSGQPREKIQSYKFLLGASDAVQKEPSMTKIVEAVERVQAELLEQKEIQKKQHILLVDDDIDQHMLLINMFNDYPNVVVHATDSTVVAKSIQRYQIKLALVDVDLQSSRKGSNLVQFLKSLSFLEKVTFLLYSGKTKEELRALAQECGAEGYINKQEGPIRLKTRILEELNKF